MGASSRRGQRPSTVLAGLLVASACAEAEPAGDVARYAAVAAEDGGTEADLATCGGISDDSLAGDCALLVVARSELPAEEACPRVPKGIWRDECWFVAAEARRAAGQDGSAAQLCLRAGAFRDDCGQHLWQTAVHDLIHRRGPAGFAAQLPRAQQLHDRWARLLAEETDFSERFWARYFSNGFEGQGGVDLSWCVGLPEPQPARCRAAGLAYFARDLGPRLDQAGLGEAFCAMEAPDAEAVGRAFPNRPEAALDEVVRERRAVLCAEVGSGD